MTCLPLQDLLMHPEHNCSADCETLHREICKKLLSLLLSRLQPVQEPAKGTNTWFGLVCPLVSVSNESLCKSFIFGAEEKKIQFGVYLDNSSRDCTLNYHHQSTGHTSSVEKDRILLELWYLEFKPKFREGNEASMTKLYKLTSYYVRSLLSILRLLPAQSLTAKGIKIATDLDEACGLSIDALREPITSKEAEQSSNILEKVESVQVGQLSTLHGDIALTVHFKTDCNFSLTPKSTAIAVPKNKFLPEHEIKIENSPDWVDMSSQLATSRPRREPKSVSYRPVIIPAKEESGRSQELAEFIKYFENPPPVKWLHRQEQLTVSCILKRLERIRADKIVLDRWLEELELAQEQSREALNFSEFVDSME